MGKPKKQKKGKDEDFEDEVDLDPLVNLSDDDEKKVPTKSTVKKSKKDKKKKSDEWDDDDDVEDKIAALSLKSEQNGSVEEVKLSKKDKKKNKKKFIEEDEGEEETEEMEDRPNKKKGSKQKPVMTFQMLMNDDNDDDEMNFESDQEETQPEMVKEERESTPAASSTKSKKDKKKEKKKQKTEDDDIEALLAEIDKPTEKVSKKKKKQQKDVTDKSEEAMETEQAGGTDNVAESEPGEGVAKVEVKVVGIDDFDDEEYDKKKKKKKKEKKEKNKDADEEVEEGNDNDEEGGTVKTAAQKKKEKKEREKEKKLKEKQKQLNKQAEKKEGLVEQEETTEKQEVTEKAEGAEGEDVTGEGEKESKKKKKKKGEKEKEEEKKDKKKSKHLAVIKAHLQKVQEEEERLRKEEEERIAKEEEAIRIKEEAKRVEEERRRIKKEKDKLRKERLREEGKLLTDKQKQDKRRAEQMLEMMKQQGFTIPTKDEAAPRKRPVYVDKKKKKQQQSENRESEEKSPSPAEAVTPVTPVVESPTTPSVEMPEPKAKPEKTGEVKDEWDAESDDDVQDDWDADMEEKNETEAPAPKVVETEKPKKEEMETESESEEEEEESSEDESSEESSEEESSEYETDSEEEKNPIERARMKISKRQEAAEKKKTTDNLRAPVVCVLGHVDTGKTKILDKLRRTHVQDNEAGGITQQIGATNVPRDAILNQTKMCKEFQKAELKLPGLLIIDTPGHESFSNLRTRGSSLCDIAILVIDLMHGLEPQTIESIKLLKKRKTPFVVALNKIDRLFQWKTNPTTDVLNTIKKQQTHTRQEFEERTREVIVQLAEQSLNAALYYENKNPKEYISLVPTSAHSGDGMGNLISIICELTQNHLAKRLAFCEELQATVMEVKALPGLGTTIDVCLVNGKVKEGDTIVIAGTGGPIVTQIRGLLMPQPMKELRVKNQYEHHKEVMAAQGVKIIAKDLENSLAGLPLYVSHDEDETEFYKNEVATALRDVLRSIKLSDRGVFVQASTIGSLEALVEFLKTSKIPYAGISIGPVHKKDVIKASVMLEHDSLYATILAFDVKVEREAQEHADHLGVKIFTADIIYHLFDNFIAYREDLKKQKQEEFKHIAVFPCKLKILPQFIFNSRDPIVMGVSVEAGFVKVGIPMCVPSKEFLSIGIITSVEINHKPQEIARKGAEVCIKIDPLPGDSPKMYGRHFDETDMLVSKISRESIDAVKNYFRDDMQKQDWQLILELKKMFEII